MAGNLSDYAEAKILDHILKTSEFVRTAQELWVGLSNTAINDATTGGDVDECTGDDYGRVQMDTWDTAGGTREINNTNTITYTEAGTEGAWGTISDWFISDSSTSGEIIAYGTFSPEKVIGTGDDASIAAGALTITVDADGMSDFLASAMLDHVFLNTEFTIPTNLYVGLAKSDIADASTGGNCDEVDGSNYAREICNTWNATDTTGAGNTENDDSITFDVASASWDTVTHFFISPDLADGDILFHGAVGVSKSVGDGDTVQFDADTLTISLD